MKNFVCWKKESAEQIINPDVDAQPDAFFRAIHTDVPIRIERQGRSGYEAISSDTFLKRFLNSANFSLVPVIGQSGAGKSHLIRWMNLRIRQNEKREVVFVPKAQTNLRDIVKELIERLPKNAQEKYLDRLRGAGSGTLTVPAQRTAILNSIQIELKNDVGGSDPDIDPEEERYLIEGLNDVLTDAHVQSAKILADKTFAAELAYHVFERPEKYQPTEQRREFSPKDLPLDIEDVQKAAERTRDFLTYLLSAGEPAQNQAVRIVNRHIDSAIARCLNLSGEQLIELMLEMRRHFKREGKELVLLIEDFARLQGLDRALLQSVLEQGKGDLCALRTAFACTTGFFDTVADTVRTRVSFVVDMDHPVGSSDDSFDLNRMVARYMNAIRIGPEQLEKDWQSSKDREIAFEVSSSCEECLHKLECHAAFGQLDGYGLFPFTERAISEMGHRADPNIDARFNARKFQNAVLRPVTSLADDICEGRFPPRSLLEDLGGLKDFPLDEQQLVKQKAPADVDRLLTLISLWLGEQRAINADSTILEAFGLRPLDLTGKPPPKPPRPGKAPKKATRPPTEVEELIGWSNGKQKLSQRTANVLRPLVFSALEEFINWDQLGCPRSLFIGQGRPFNSQGGIYFQNQTTKPTGHALASITVPFDWSDDNERTTTYLALRGLLEAFHHRSWNIDDAARKFVSLQECLSSWSRQIAEQLQEIREGPVDWNPACAALELRLLGILLTTPMDKAPDASAMLGLALGPFGGIRGFATSELKRMVEAINAKESELLKAVRAGRSVTKGGQVGTYFDSTDLIETLKAFKDRGYVPMTLPEESKVRWNLHKEVLAVAKLVQRQLTPALDKEIAARLGWQKRALVAFGDERDTTEIAESLRSAVRSVSDVPGLHGTHELLANIQLFASSAFDESIKSVGNLARRVSKDQTLRPWDFAIDIENTVTVSDALVTNARTYFDRAEKQIDALLRTGGVDSGEFQKLKAQTVEDLKHIVTYLGGGAGAHTS